MRYAVLLALLAGLTSPTENRAAEPVSVATHPKLAVERCLTLGPSPGNPRNSEGDFIRLKDGRWLFVYSHFTGGAGDDAKAFLASRESSDGGKTWTARDQMVVTNEGGLNVMSVSLLRLRAGGIALFYLRKNSLQDCRPVMRLSLDEGKTWGAPTECITNEAGYYVLNNSRVIQLENGRLVMPAALHGSDGRRLQPGTIVVFLSDDSGKTWHRSRTMLASDTSRARQNFMEPGVVEAGTNRLLMVIRTRVGSQYVSESGDNGETWSPARPGELLTPEAPATVVRIPSTGDLLVVWNDHCKETEGYWRDQPSIRTPLAGAISRDGGRTWGNHTLIEDEAGHGYCYTAVAFSGDRVLLAYCAHAAPNVLQTTQISSFRLADLYR